MRSSAACVDRYADAGKPVTFAPGDVPPRAAQGDRDLAPGRESHRQRARLRRAAGRGRRRRASRDMATIDVADRGAGIAPDEVERLKQPFTRATEARARADGAAGAGLGLAIVDRIARLHGGRFDLLPRDGGGTLARVTLPLAGKPWASEQSETGEGSRCEYATGTVDGRRLTCARVTNCDRFACLRRSATRGAPRRAPGTPAVVEAPRPSFSRWQPQSMRRDSRKAQVLATALSMRPPTPRSPARSRCTVTSSSFATSVPRDVEIAQQTTHAPTASRAASRRATYASQTNPTRAARETGRARASSAADRRRRRSAADRAVVRVVAEERRRAARAHRRAVAARHRRAADDHVAASSVSRRRAAAPARRGSASGTARRAPCRAVDPHVHEAARSPPARRLPRAEQPDLVDDRRCVPSCVTRRPASTVSGNDSGRWNRHDVSTTKPTTGPLRMSSPPARIRCSFTAVSKYE